MPTVKLTGFLTDAFPTEQITPNFRKRIFWLQESDARDARYANTWEVELYQDDCDRLDDFQLMDLLEAECEVRGRKTAVGMRERVFLALKCTGLRKSGKAATITGPPSYRDRREGGYHPPASLFPYTKRH